MPQGVAIHAANDEVEHVARYRGGWSANRGSEARARLIKPNLDEKYIFDRYDLTNAMREFDYPGWRVRVFLTLWLTCSTKSLMTIASPRKTNSPRSDMASNT